MGREAISKFKDKPINKSTWTGMWLGIASIFIFPILGINAKFIRPLADNYLGEGRGAIAALIIAISCIALAIVAFVLNIKSYRKGERSWVMWIGLAPSVLIGILFAVIIGAELFEGIRSAITGEPMRY